MTTLLFAAVALIFAFAIYVGVLSGRQTSAGGEFVHGGHALPPWAFIFAGSGILLGSLSLHDHFLLTALYGFQYNHVALGLMFAALCATLVYKRLWLAARMSGLDSPIEIVGAYYRSVALRVFLLGLTMIFAIPFAAVSLALAGDLVTAASGGVLTRSQTIFVLAVFLFLFSVLGGWRGVVYVVAAQSFLLLVLMLFVGAFTASAFDGLTTLSSGIKVMSGVLPDQIPGVMQYSSGVGKEEAPGGIWTTLAIISFGASLVGVVLSPAMSFLSITVRTRTSFAFHQVWMVAGLATGVLLIVSPLIGAEVAVSNSAAPHTGVTSYTELIGRFASRDQFAALCLLLMLLGSMQIVVAFLTAAGANLLTIDLLQRYVLPNLPGEGRRLAARIALALLYATVALMAAFAPLLAAILGSVALSLSVQFLPAYIGLCWAPWISRSAVLTGLIFGGLLVILTEPPGLIFFEGLFFDLPWGRWPLTIHSAVWGLGFNVVACLIVSLFTHSGPEHAHREMLHQGFRDALRGEGQRSALGTAKWSLTLIWSFLALGPGAILGNSFFSKPIFSEGEATLGVPSLWVWQIVFWFLGVLLVWWLAYRARMSIIQNVAWRRIDLDPPLGQLERRRTPPWIALLLARVAER
jgi:solute:Na+ symporter, SSS family